MDTAKSVATTTREHPWAPYDFTYCQKLNYQLDIRNPVLGFAFIW